MFAPCLPQSDIAPGSHAPDLYLSFQFGRQCTVPAADCEPQIEQLWILTAAAVAAAADFNATTDEGIRHNKKRVRAAAVGTGY